MGASGEPGFILPSLGKFARANTFERVLISGAADNALLGHGRHAYRRQDAMPTIKVLDRLLHRSRVLNIKGRSYRLRELESALAAAH